MCFLNGNDDISSEEHLKFENQGGSYLLQELFILSNKLNSISWPSPFLKNYWTTTTDRRVCQDWRSPLSRVLSVIMVFSAPACWGRECTPTPFYSIYPLHSSYFAHSAPSPARLARKGYLHIALLLFSWYGTDEINPTIKSVNWGHFLPSRDLAWHYFQEKRRVCYPCLVPRRRFRCRASWVPLRSPEWRSFLQQKRPSEQK